MNIEEKALTKQRMLKATKVEVFASLAEGFGTNYRPSNDQSMQDLRMNFQIDRLFSIIHKN